MAIQTSKQMEAIANQVLDEMAVDEMAGLLNSLRKNLHRLFELTTKTSNSNRILECQQIVMKIQTRFNQIIERKV